MSLPVYFHEAAAEEAEAAFVWYYERSPNAAWGFIDELTRQVEDIHRTPHIFAPYRPGTRRAVLRRYPFYLVFLESPDRIDVLAVAHAKRRPGYWRKRQTL